MGFPSFYRSFIWNVRPKKRTSRSCAALIRPFCHFATRPSAAPRTISPCSTVCRACTKRCSTASSTSTTSMSKSTSTTRFDRFLLKQKNKKHEHELLINWSMCGWWVESGERRSELGAARQVCSLLRSARQKQDRERLPAARARGIRGLLSQAQRALHRAPQQEDLRRQAFHRGRLPAPGHVLRRRQHAQWEHCQALHRLVGEVRRRSRRPLQGRPRTHRHPDRLLHYETLSHDGRRGHRLAQDMSAWIGHRTSTELSRRVIHFETFLLKTIGLYLTG